MTQLNQITISQNLKKKKKNIHALKLTAYIQMYIIILRILTTKTLYETHIRNIP